MGNCGTLRERFLKILNSPAPDFLFADRGKLHIVPQVLASFFKKPYAALSQNVHIGKSSMFPFSALFANRVACSSECFTRNLSSPASPIVPPKKKAPKLHLCLRALHENHAVSVACRKAKNAQEKVPDLNVFFAYDSRIKYKRENVKSFFYSGKIFFKVLD